MFLIELTCIVFLLGDLLGGGIVCNAFKGQDRNELLRVSSRLWNSWKYPSVQDGLEWAYQKSVLVNQFIYTKCKLATIYGYN